MKKVKFKRADGSTVSFSAKSERKAPSSSLTPFQREVRKQV